MTNMYFMNLSNSDGTEDGLATFDSVLVLFFLRIILETCLCASPFCVGLDGILDESEREMHTQGSRLVVVVSPSP